MSSRNAESRSSFLNASPLSSLPHSSPTPIPISGPSTQQHLEQWKGRRPKESNVASYKLRSRSARQEEPDENQPIESLASGHFTKAETEFLKDAFNNGVWTPGNLTVKALKTELKDRDGRLRSDKQIRDWFSHQRRKHRESGKNMTGENVSDAVEGLLYLKHQPMQNKLRY